MGKGGGIRVYHVIIVLLILYLWSQGYFDQILGSLNVFQIEERAYYGNLDIKIQESNWFNGSSVSTSSASYRAFAGDFRNIGGSSLTAGSTTTIALNPEDNGIVWIEFYGGTGHYINPEALVSQNKRADLYQYYDRDGDGYSELFVRFDVSDYEPGSDPAPILFVTVPLIPKDVTGLSDDNPSDISSIGTSTTTKQITWKFSGLGEGTGLLIHRIYVKSNVTTGNEDIAFEDLILNGWGISRSFGQPKEEANDNYRAYYVGTEFSDPDLSKGILAYRGINKPDQFYVTLNVKCMFESGDAVQVTIYIDVLDTDGSLETTLSDTVVLSA